MMLKTHLAVTFLFILLFISHITGIFHKVLFLVVVLISSMLPDIDLRYSTIGKSKLARPFQLFVKHRNFVHSLTFCMILTLMLVFLYPVLALSFFIGYSIHLFLDSFTPEGILFFWPYKEKSKGKIRTDGAIDRSLFLVFLGLDILALIFIMMGFFS
jgi:inner membrane protein